ncbi:MAG: hypothetical protein ILO34_05845 [Kiritimatiellae bacterium]|nr:hypothetical protein [Kiritimatiellia bacterium]
MTIGKPIAKRTAEGTVLSAAVSFQGISDECFYSVPAEFAGLADTESSNCFLVGMLYPAMRYGEDIRVEGRVSAKLLYNLNEYLVPMMAIVDPRLKRIRIEAGSADGNFHPGAKAVGTGFSGGIDSFATIYEHLERPSPEGFRLTHLFFFNVGAHGIPKKPGDMESIGRQFRARFEKLKAFPREVSLPFVPVDSNVHKFHPWGHLEVATFATVSAVLFLQRGIRRYYLASSGHTYRQLWKFLGDGGRPDAIERVNMMLLPWLSTESVDIVDDGNLYDRSAKTAIVAEYAPAAKYLNVCYGHDTLDTNCSVCPKCARTLLTLEILGKLDAFSGVFDIGRYRREVRRRLIAETIVGRRANLFARHLSDLARERGFDLRGEVNALDLFRAKMLNGRLHAFIRGNPLLKRLAKGFFK